MVIPNNIATLGVYPSYNTFSRATLGFLFSFEIDFGIIKLFTGEGVVVNIETTPVVRRPIGGGELEVYDITDSRRIVTITIKHKNKIFTQSLTLNTIVMNIIDIFVKFMNVINNRIKVKCDIVENKKTPIITVKKK